MKNNFRVALPAAALGALCAVHVAAAFRLDSAVAPKSTQDILRVLQQRNNNVRVIQATRPDDGGEKQQQARSDDSNINLGNNDNAQFLQSLKPRNGDFSQQLTQQFIQQRQLLQQQQQQQQQPQQQAGGAQQQQALDSRGLLNYGYGGGYHGSLPVQQYPFFELPRPQSTFAALQQAARPIPQIYNPCLYYGKYVANTRYGVNGVNSGYGVDGVNSGYGVDGGYGGNGSYGVDGGCGVPIPYNETSTRPLEPRSDVFGYPNYFIPKHFIPLGIGKDGHGYGSYEGGSGYGGSKNGTQKIFYFNYPPKPEYREPEADIYGYPGYYVPKIFVPHGIGPVGGDGYGGAGGGGYGNSGSDGYGGGGGGSSYSGTGGSVYGGNVGARQFGNMLPPSGGIPRGV